MAEIIGVAASIAGLAGTAASISLVLFNCSSTVVLARDQLEDLAMEASLLSEALGHVGRVLKEEQEMLVANIMRSAETVVRVCENVLAQMRAIADMSRSRAARFKWFFGKSRAQEIRLKLSSLKSTLTVMLQTILVAKAITLDSTGGSSPGLDKSEVLRNIDVLRTAVITNHRSIRRLNRAEGILEKSRQNDDKDPGDSIDLGDVLAELPETIAKDNRRKPTGASRTGFFGNKKKETTEGSHDTEAPGNPREDEVTHSTTKNGPKGTTREDSQKELTDELSPASMLLMSSVPHSNSGPAVALQYDPIMLPDIPQNLEATPRQTVEQQATNDIKLLLREWTTVSGTLVAAFLGDSQGTMSPKGRKVNERASTSDHPHLKRSISEGDNGTSSPASYTPSQSNYPISSSKSDAPSRTSGYTSPPASYNPVQPSIRKAYEALSPDSSHMGKLLSYHGWSPIWLHRDQFKIAFFVGSRKVLEYELLPEDAKIYGERSRDQTLLSKQFVRNEVIKALGFSVQSHDDGHFSIPGHLPEKTVRKIHDFSYRVIEEDIRATAQMTLQDRRVALAPKVQALWSFEASESGDLSFRRGDIIAVIGPMEGNWWTGVLQGRCGNFPSNYVEELTEASLENLEQEEPRTSADSGKANSEANEWRPPVPSGLSSKVTDSPGVITQLQAMGFDREKVIEALVATDFVTGRAVECLINNAKTH